MPPRAERPVLPRRGSPASPGVSGAAGSGQAPASSGVASGKVSGILKFYLIIEVPVNSESQPLLILTLSLSKSKAHESRGRGHRAVIRWALNQQNPRSAPRVSCVTIRAHASPSTRIHPRRRVTENRGEDEAGQEQLLAFLAMMPPLLPPRPPLGNHLKSVFPPGNVNSSRARSPPRCRHTRGELPVPPAGSRGAPAPCSEMSGAGREGRERKFRAPRVPSRHSCRRRPGLRGRLPRGSPGPAFARGPRHLGGCQQAADSRHCQHNTRLCFLPVC